MDNENIRFEFVNGSTITGIYEPYPAFMHIDTRTPFDEPNTARGRQAPGLFYDEFVDEDWMDEFDSYYTTEGCQGGLNVDEYEFWFNGDRFAIKKKAAPDFGEISPSQELNDFVNTLVLGE